MAALKLKSTAKQNVVVLVLMVGCFRKLMSPEESLEMGSAIEDFRQGQTALITPITLIRHYVKKYKLTTLEDQVYLNPHPSELLLRDHVFGMNLES